MGTTASLFLIASIWVLIGVSTAVIMGRRGHHAWSWFVSAAALGPLAIPLAIGASRRHPTGDTRNLSRGSTAPGPVDVLVGIDGSKDSIEALRTVTGLLGPRLGRVTLAAVLDRDLAETPGRREEQRRAEEALRDASNEVRHPVPSTILLEGSPARALMDHAVAHGYGLLAIGRRGGGATKSLIGSVASVLARGSDVPVLIV